MRKTLEEIRKTPVLKLSPEEIAQLDPAGQSWAKLCQTQHAREQACPGHEAQDLGDISDHMRGWHPARCKHCGMHMSVDSGD
jgi:hypothetical protein